LSSVIRKWQLHPAKADTSVLSTAAGPKPSRAHAGQKTLTMDLIRRMTAAVSLFEWRRLRTWSGRCPLCGPSVLVQVSKSAIGVRCLRCAASAITMSLVSVLQEEIRVIGSLHVYELSARGPLLAWLRRHAGRVTYSEYFDGVSAGEMVNGVQCQDVQKLTYDDASFDLCTSTEVFEHVPDDARGFAELHRVLRPGGRLVFSVPITSAVSTVERAVIEKGSVRHLLPPEYHGDRIRGQGQVLVYRDYGLDIVERLKVEGFREARLVRPVQPVGGYSIPIVVATA
jgi:SAM-dependent methyltransferase